LSQPAPSAPSWSHGFFRDYGMIFILLALIALFSVLTWTQQFPEGREAGQQVAEAILKQQGVEAAIIVVARDTAIDQDFADQVRQQLSDRGATVHQVAFGSPASARKAIEETLAKGQPISGFAVNDATYQWSVYDAFEETRGLPKFQPTPYQWPNFLKISNLLGVANQTAVYATIAIGMTMVILTAGIDLSVGSLVALAAVTSALYLRDIGGGAEGGWSSTLIATLVAILVCGIVGATSGAFITLAKLPPFIVTLGVMLMANGLAFRLADGNSIAELPRSYFWLGGGQTAGIPNPVLIMLGLYLVAHLIMSHTIFGRYVYAIGSNQEASRLSGVPIAAILIGVYAISGALAGLGGVMLASMLQAGDPKFGLMYELDVIAAVVVGGTSLMGGRGKVFGTLIGAFIIAVIKNGMNLTNVEPFNQKIVLGAVLLLAVLVDTAKRDSRWRFLWRPLAHLNKPRAGR
jgi:ribose transport system permease protein